MPVVPKSAEEIEYMRRAGRLAAEVLDFIAPKVRAGASTGELDQLCHQYMVEVQGTVPAPSTTPRPDTNRFPSRSARQ